jgi:hypothetical protein
MRRGDNEPDPTSVHGQVTRRTPPVKLKDPAMLIDLGVTNLEAPVGFFTQRRIIAPVLKGQPALVRGLDGSLTMVSAEAAAKLKPTEVKDLRSGPALLIDGKTVSPSPAPTGRHSALGWGKNHLFFVSTLDVATTAAHMRDLGAHTAMLLTETPLTGPRLAWLAADKATGLKELNPDGTSDGDTSARGRSTHLYFERLAEPERVARLELEDVELSKEEARRQLRLQLEIKTLRQELRQIENAKYRAFQEKMKARREGKK